jgi:CHAT domain-containing protein/tetratricopeptide (TPR) repeat protein
MLLLEMEEVPSALALLAATEATWLEILDPEVPKLVDLLVGLSLMYRRSGEAGHAEAHFRRGHEIASRGGSALGRLDAYFLRGLAGLHEERGEFAEAERLYREAVRLVVQPGPRRASAVLATVDGLINVMWARGKHAEREPFMLNAVGATFAAYPDGHPFLADRLDDLGRLYHTLGRFDWAEAVYERALEIRGRRFGKDTSLCALSLTNLGELHAATDRPGRALEFLRHAADIEDTLIGRLIPGRTEREQNAYVLMFQPGLFRFVSLVLDRFASDPSAVGAAFDLTLRRKAVGVEAQAIARGSVLAASYPRLAPLMDRLNRLRWEIARRSLVEPGGQASSWEDRRTLEAWVLQKEALEARLAREIPELRLELRVAATNRRALREILPEGAVLVEYLRLHPFDFSAPATGGSRWGRPRYLAFVHPSAVTRDVVMLDLGEVYPIDDAISDLGSRLASDEANSPDRDLVTRGADGRSSRAEAGRRLFDAILRPLLPAIGDRRRLFLAPDGPLFLVPFEVLTTGEGRHVIDEFEISYLSNGRDLTRLRERPALAAGAALVLADPAYDHDVAEGGTADAAPGNLPAPAPDGPTGAWAMRRSRDLIGAGLRLEGLPGTRVEGERVGRLLGVASLTRSRASEDSVKSARSPRVLHLATHGFFLPDQAVEGERVGALLDAQTWMEEATLRSRHAVCSRAILDLFTAGLALAIVRPEVFQAVDDREQELVRLRRATGGASRLVELECENTLLRSGIALAGANTGLAGVAPDAGEDGLLTAEEVTGLDLAATELVVLSACDTGLDQIRTGEGVFGLRRAFVLAGARTLVLSLWKVSDLATALLMERFYENLTLRRKGCSAALHEAQRFLRGVTVGELRTTWLTPDVIERFDGAEIAAGSAMHQLSCQPDDHRPFDDPYYWGAFICQGDPSPLST